ncbi:MAG: hypothetical protein CMB77_04065 [Euryarchaeota archaeon]|nr:hypothetical protein [Euryarchaeota archaeon]
MSYKEKIKQRQILRELRKAKAELSMLSSYLLECEDALTEYSLEWSSDLKFILEHLSPKTEPTSNEKEEKQTLGGNSFHHYKDEKKLDEVELKPNTPEWAKKAFRKIALKTHPDKVRDQPNAKELEDLYAKANEAVFEENYDMLLEICNLLSIENNLDPELELKYNEKRRTSIKEELQKITESLPWVWCESYDNPAIREGLLLSVLPHYGINNLTKEDVSDILEKLLSR